MDEKTQEELAEILFTKRPPWKPFDKNIMLTECIPFCDEFWEENGFK